MKDEEIRKIAKFAHEINRAYCQALGDNTQPTWEMALPWQVDSALAGVQFHIDNPDAGPEASHESWCQQKYQDGWLYGDEKDPVNKEHPCLLPFWTLPKHEKAKDYLFRQVVHSYLDLTLAC